VLSKDEWDTKEGTGKSMKSTFYEEGASKGTSREEATSNRKKSSP